MIAFADSDLNMDSIIVTTLKQVIEPHCVDTFQQKTGTTQQRGWAKRNRSKDKQTRLNVCSSNSLSRQQCTFILGSSLRESAKHTETEQ